MPRKSYALAIACILLIPITAIGGGMVFAAINPESAAGHPDYVRNYRLLAHVRDASMVATGLAIAGLWLLGCWCLVRDKARHGGWTALSALGPLGLTFLSMLKDRSVERGGVYGRLVDGLRTPWRAVYEAGLFFAVWWLAFEAEDVASHVGVLYEAARRGVPIAQILAERNASGGMWAFSETLKAGYFVVLIYLFWPIAFNLAARLLSRSTKRAGE